MIRLHPIPDANHACPYCQVRLDARGWYIPGMRTLAVLHCPHCKRDFYGDLPSGHGLIYPMLIEQATGVVHDAYGVRWFADWLGDSYANRVKVRIDFAVENLRALKQPVLLNCLDTLYGHCFLKLSNAQYYLDERPELDLIVLVPRFLRWAVPEGAAAIWVVDLPLKRGIEWNDWLAEEIKRRLERFDRCWLSVGLSHPHPEDYNIERFTRVRPFVIDEWNAHLERPKVTFIWREDRLWCPELHGGRLQAFEKRLERRVNFLGPSLKKQRQRVLTLAQSLRRAVPQIDFTVAGVGHPGQFANWIHDLRNLEINEDVERNWCERYAQSHVVIGVHGSNMLLPSAHAGTVIELVPADHWGNVIQDILLSPQDIREAMFRHRFLPLDTSPYVVAEVTTSLIRHLPHALLNFKRLRNDRRAIENAPCLKMKRDYRIGA